MAVKYVSHESKQSMHEFALKIASMGPQTPEHGRWGEKLGKYSRTIFPESDDQMDLAYSISEEKKKYTVKIHCDGGGGRAWTWHINAKVMKWFTLQRCWMNRWMANVPFSFSHLQPFLGKGSVSQISVLASWITLPRGFRFHDFFNLTCSLDRTHFGGGHKICQDHQEVFTSIFLQFSSGGNLINFTEIKLSFRKYEWSISLNLSYIIICMFNFITL